MKCTKGENLMKPISTSVHGILDYVSVGTLLAAPRLFGWNGAVRQLLSIAALGTLGYSLMTRYELGLIKALPMQSHLALDAASGALLCAAPLFLRQAEGSARAALVGMGLFELAAAALTQTEPSADIQSYATSTQPRW
jgi:hypothetical protein